MNKLICHICGDIDILSPICRKCSKEALRQNDKIVAQKIFAELEKEKIELESLSKSHSSSSEVFDCNCEECEKNAKAWNVLDDLLQKLKQKFGGQGDKE